MIEAFFSTGLSIVVVLAVGFLILIFLTNGRPYPSEIIGRFRSRSTNELPPSQTR